MKKIISFLLLLAILVTLPSTALALDLESDSLSEKLYISSYDCPTQYASFAEETVHLFLESSEFSELSPCYLGNHLPSLILAPTFTIFQFTTQTGLFACCEYTAMSRVKFPVFSQKVLHPNSTKLHLLLL